MKTYVSLLTDDMRAELLQNLPQFYGDGRGKAEITYSSNDSIVISLFNSQTKNADSRLLIFELYDYYLELKWINSKAFVMPNLKSINDYWINFLKTKFKSYKQDYIDFHNQIINGKTCNQPINFANVVNSLNEN